MDWLVFAKELGFLGALVGFLTWQAWIRESRMAARVGVLETVVETKLIQLVTDTTLAINNSTAALTHTSAAIHEFSEYVTNNTEKMDELLSELKYRPCLLPKKK